MYYNSTNNKFRVYENSSWQDILTSASGVFKADGSISMTGQLVAGNAGGAGAPDYSFSGSLTTGFFRPAANSIGFSTGGTERMRLQDGGLDMMSRFFANGGSAATPSISFTADNTTGLYLPAANEIGLSTNSNLRLKITNGAIVPMVPVASSDGSASAPALTFASTSDMGLYRASATELGFAAAGTMAATMSASQFTVAGNVLTANGNAGAPAYSFASETGTGMFRPAAAQLAFTLNGTEAGRFDTGGVLSLSDRVRAADGTAASPTYTFTSNPTTGMYLDSFGVLAFATVTSERMRIDNAGRVGIGTLAPSVTLDMSGRNDAMRLPVGSTAARPASPQEGMIRHNNETNEIEAYEGSEWRGLRDSAYAFAVKNNASDNINAGAGSLITFNNEERDADAVFSGSQFTAPKDGVYFFTASVTMAGGGGGQNITMKLEQGANTFASSLTSVTGTAGESACVSGAVFLTSGQTVTVRVIADATARNTDGATSRFSGFRISK